MIEELRFALTPLQRTPAALHALLHDVDDRWARANYGPQTFSPFDVVGHLLHGERTDWLPRARHILSNDPNPFTPFDRYAMVESSRDKSMNTLLDEFALARRESLDELSSLNITTGCLAKRGLHPALGPVTLGQLLATWVVHDLHHLAQIAKAMSFQLKDDVGPWREYLGILPKA